MKIRQILFAGIAVSILCGGCFGKHENTAELNAKAEAYAVKGLWDKALEYSKRAVDNEPGNVRALVLNTLAYENNGKTSEAIEEISKAAALQPDSYFIQYTKGRLLYDRGRYESCVAPLKEAHRLRPSSPDALVLLAEVSVRQKNIREAQTYYGRLAKLPLFARDPAPWNEIGMNMLIDGRNPRGAYPYFSYAYKLAPSNPATVLNMAVVLDSYFNRKNDARAYYLRYLSLTKQDTSLANERSSVEARLKSIASPR